MKIEPLRHDRNLQGLVVLLDPPRTIVNVVFNSWGQPQERYQWRVVRPCALMKKGRSVRRRRSRAAENVIRKSITLVQRKVLPSLLNLHHADSFELFGNLSGPIRAAMADDKDCVGLVE